MNIKTYGIINFEVLGFDYIGVPKNGTTSFLASCLKYLNTPIDLTSETYDTDLQIHSKNIVKYIIPTESLENNLSKVIILRNPENRLLSVYNDFCFGNKSKYHKVSGSKSFIKQWNIFFKSDKNIDYFLELLDDFSDTDKDAHLRSQCWFIEPFSNLENCLFFTVEHVDKIYTTLNKKFNLKLEICNRNITYKKITKFNEKVKEKIYIQYQKDYDLWKKYYDKQE